MLKLLLKTVEIIQRKEFFHSHFMPFFKLFSEFYQNTVELIERHTVFFLVSKRNQINKLWNVASETHGVTCFLENVKLDTENYTGIYPGNSQDLLNPHYPFGSIHYHNEEQFTYTEETPDFVTMNFLI